MSPLEEYSFLAPRMHVAFSLFNAMRQKLGTAEPSAPLTDGLPPENILFGPSSAMAEVRQKAEKLCRTNLPVLLCGLPGTGKETVARWIHGHSQNPTGPFVKVNCAAIPTNLLESELFGYERGSFTGADHTKRGWVEAAHHGTLFLDEIADLDPGLQSRLLHFLQDGTYARIGGEEERVVNTRFICSTNRDLSQEIASGKFRIDLFYRISVFQLKLPSLRERRDDIPSIVDYLRKCYEKQFEKKSEPVSPEMLNLITRLSWPGNLRELSNYVARYVLMGSEATFSEIQKFEFTQENVPSSHGSRRPLKVIAKQVVREKERSLILSALQANQWNRRRTAEALRISYRALIYKIRESGLLQEPGERSPDGL